MLGHLLNKLQEDTTRWENIRHLFSEAGFPAKTILLKEGEIAGHIYFIKKGCLRLWFNDDGKDITFQFFFENRAVASIESFLKNAPSRFNLETIEPTSVLILPKESFNILMEEITELREGFQEIMMQRLENYTRLFLSRIKDNPQKRYLDLIENNPQIVQRVPQHYIASYLGITPVSLSRIRNKR